MRVTHLNFRSLELVAFHPLVGADGRLDLHTDPFRAVADVDAALLVAGLIHQGQRMLHAHQGGFTIGVHIVHRRRLRQPGQEGRLRQRQVAGRGAKIGLGRRLDAVSQVAVINLIQVQLKDFILGVAAGDLGASSASRTLRR
jgi:hypothetical protein